jgi:hypothetical protein
VQCLQTFILADYGENGRIDRQKFSVEYVAFQLCVCVCVCVWLGEGEKSRVQIVSVSDISDWHFSRFYSLLPAQYAGFNGSLLLTLPFELNYSMIFLVLSVGAIATCYGLKGPGIESRWGRDFPHSSLPALGPPPPASYTFCTGSLSGGKRPGCVVDHLPHLAPRLKNQYSCASTPPLDLRGLF